MKQSWAHIFQNSKVFIYKYKKQFISVSHMAAPLTANHPEPLEGTWEWPWPGNDKELMDEESIYVAMILSQNMFENQWLLQFYVALFFCQKQLSSKLWKIFGVVVWDRGSWKGNQWRCENW